MRSVVGVLVAAAIGIHCSAPVEPETTTSELETVAPAGEVDREPPRARAEPAPATEPAPVAADSRWADSSVLALVPSGIPPHVTSTVKDATGATYMTGTFEGSVAIGKTVIHSRGEKDVFLLKIDAAGGIQWARGVGSEAAERAPRVTLEEGRITLLGLTHGEMDCGTGPLQWWSSDMFFVCMFEREEGTTVGSGVFPTGSP